MIWVVRGKDPHAVDEIVNGYDTPDMIRQIQGRYPGHRINLYPDASGGGRRSVDASQSDLALLRQARFSVFVNGHQSGSQGRGAGREQIVSNGERHLFRERVSVPQPSGSLRETAVQAERRTR